MVARIAANALLTESCRKVDTDRATYAADIAMAHTSKDGRCSPTLNADPVRAVIESARSLCLRMDEISPDALSGLAPQLLASACIVCACLWEQRVLCVRSLAHASVSCTVPQVLSAYVKVSALVNALRARSLRKANGTASLGLDALPTSLEKIIFTENSLFILRPPKSTATSGPSSSPISSASARASGDAGLSRSSGVSGQVRSREKMMQQTSPLFIPRGRAAQARTTTWQPQRSLGRNTSNGGMASQAGTNATGIAYNDDSEVNKRVKR